MKCGEAILSGEPLRAHAKALLELKAEIDEVMSPAEVAVVREMLGLSRRKAGEVLGGGPRAFQKYEAGTQAVSAPMSNLLRLLAKDPSRLGELVGRGVRPVRTAAARRSARTRSRERAAAG
jgi:HTH-type transcriptional regulator/antitoxin MqsA